MAEKVKKKKFVKIIAPKQFNEQVMGESLVGDPRSLLGRYMKINMMSLTNDPKNQNVQIKLKINNLKQEDVTTEIRGYRLLPSFIKRLVRKDKRRVDDYFIVKTSDNKKLIIKTFLLTLNRTSKSVLTSLRKATKEAITQKAEKLSTEQFLTEVFQHRLQNVLRKELAKVYPLKQCEIKNLDIVEEKKTEEDIKKEQKPVEIKEVKEQKPAEEKKEVKEKAKKEQKPAEEKKESKSEESKEVKEEVKEEKKEEKKDGKA
jgi:ribosomal protein S3AE